MIEISNLNFKYRKQQNLFNGLSLFEGNGSIVGLLGKNGAGKSTLLKLIAGLLDAPKSELTVMGDDPFRRNPSLLEDIYFLPEEYDLPSVKISVYAKANSVFYPRFDKVLLTKLLNDFEIDANSNISKLSYGQKKKFLIAFALSTNCKLLIFDEPTNGLDIPSKAIFRKVVAGFLSEDQLILISTHQVKDIESLIDKVIILDKGTVVLHQSTWEISEKYAFNTVTNPDEVETVYHEVAPGGFKVMRPANGAPTDVDLEVLFNAAISGVNLK